MAKTVDIHEAKQDLSRLLADVEKGGEGTIMRAGKVVARLVPVDPPARFELGFERGKSLIAPDFDDPMPDDWLDQWERRSLA